ncbi:MULTISPECIES: gliding motility-associated C-terminal domain-containing protein [Chryseobacterium]|uniref:Gliding motility-associated C-terminal domain n=1 Tax=Chryseobacterium balustinum TaxID=246 RepID=A0AAX2IGS5_9FLAO|nr:MULTISPECIES: gliding motility-associated C-terminal domain-containing protein [Chryseobacterium]AZB31105.1 gliding motility-associated C-terminal domain-containing protein [Chryseobacterium balustinum]MDY0929547.1 gliding motility-associated C-terminal domain-containing protein [Chryseobacterium sp. CFBP8996]SKB40187.1 gliding motility-associated C-terminal domain-containing protein [Chryseobacterium balustinum]SQA87824.1 gliding motility-associated C-terminal domain [Chryseobacterium balus
MKKTLLFFLMIITQMIFAQSSSDCGGTVQVCGNTPISFTPTGPGDIKEDLGGCMTSDEHFSIWYTFTVATSGTLTFTIVPNAMANDYDWALYGPDVACSSLGTPIRCNYSGTPGLTGLNFTNTNTTADATGSPFCSFMNVVAGQTYYIVVDNFSQSANGFVLNWGGTATLVSPFTAAFQPNPFIAPGNPAANPTAPNEVIVCTEPPVFDFSTLSSGIINGNPNFVASYYKNSNDAISGNNPILGPIPVNTTDTYYYVITYVDPSAPGGAISKCRLPGTFKFVQRAINVVDATLTSCNNNNAGTAMYDLTTANVINDPTVVKKYYPSLADLNNGTSEITNPYQYVSAVGSVFVLVTSQFGCTDIAEIKLTFYPEIIVTEATLRSCFLEINPSTAQFDLTVATVNTQGMAKKYYPSVADAINQTNEIVLPANHIAPTGYAYVRVSNGNGCYKIAKVNLIVISPVYSTVLVDKIICAEDKTTLDAGPGFSSYLWSTGATTQTISNVGVGTYWVKLKTGDCTAKQNVKVYASEVPVVSSIEISNSTITVHVIGGMPSYQYSLNNNTSWQDSNVFTNISRGDHTIFVRDNYKCIPIQINVVVPNITNVITPNGDGMNDVIDYSALSGKQNLVLSIFDRYGAKIYQADKTNGYKWDGTSNGGKKASTGNYWYSVTWNENNKQSTQIKFSGWVLLKNRE